MLFAVIVPLVRCSHVLSRSYVTDRSISSFIIAPPCGAILLGFIVSQVEIASGQNMVGSLIAVSGVDSRFVIIVELEQSGCWRLRDDFAFIDF